MRRRGAGRQCGPDSKAVRVEGDRPKQGGEMLTLADAVLWCAQPASGPTAGESVKLEQVGDRYPTRGRYDCGAVGEGECE